MADDSTHHDLSLPREPVHRFTAPIERFMHVEVAGGVALVVCTVLALALANSPASKWFLGLWKTEVGFSIGTFEMVHSLKHWINDGLMAIFFFVVGMEVKREIVVGELRSMKQASLPIAAALGGMLVPAGIYLALQHNGQAPNGWGIPMATDIAFVVGCMAVLGKRMPHALRVMLLSLAIVDDIGAVLVIAVAYTESINVVSLGLGFGLLALVFACGRIGVRAFGPYVVLGVLAWVAFHESGVHATIAGVVLGLLTPTGAYMGSKRVGEMLRGASDLLHGGAWDAMNHRSGKAKVLQRAAREAISPVEYLEGTLHPWVAFAIVPLFALANAGVPISADGLTHPVALAVGAGLLVGKPVGIVLFSFAAVKLGLATLPRGVGWSAIAGAGALAGIGFTMAMFIAGLAFKGPDGAATLDASKVGILGASALAAALGLGALFVVLKPTRSEA